jgi:hypothetical protein
MSTEFQDFFFFLSYTERFLALLPCTYVLQPTLVSSLPDLFTTS